MHEDLLSLLPRATPTRRQFVVTTLAAGFALAVQPVSAETITTDAKGLEAGEVKIPVDEGRRDARLPGHARRAAARSRSSWSCEEIFGVHEHIKDICRRFAKLGYLAVAPELFARAGRRVEDHRHQGDHLQGRLQGPRRPGDVGPRRDGRLGQEERQGRHGEARHHRLLLGRPHRLAVRGPQQGPQGRRGLVRPAGRRQPTTCTPRTRSTWSARSRPRCWACTAAPTRAFRSSTVEQMRKAAQGREARRRRSSSTPTRRTASTPTTGPATARRRPRTAGSGCWSGSRSTAWRERNAAWRAGGVSPLIRDGIGDRVLNQGADAPRSPLCWRR